MKKSLIAIVSALAVSGAYADSGASAEKMNMSDQVQIYGLIDYGYLDKTTTVGGVKTYESGIVPNTSAQTRIGFKGHESLGGGNSAHFVLEFGLDPGAATTPVTMRQGYVAIGNTNFGKLSIGRQHTFTYNALIHANASGIALLPGSIFYARPKELDRANSVSYSIGNELVSVNASYLVDNRSDKKADGTQNSPDMRAFELGTKLTYDKLTGNIAYTTASFGDGTTLPSYGYGFKPLTGPIDAKTLMGNVGYDFGFAKLGYTAYYLKADGIVGTPVTIKAVLHEVGATVPVTKVVDLFGSYTIAKVDLNDDSMHGSGYQAGGRYTLSKRTSVYAAFGQQQLKAPAAYKETAYTVGLKHTF